MAAEPEDGRVWVGRIQPERRDEHESFVAWLNSAEADAIFRRRRLTEYVLSESGDTVKVVFKAPRMGDPRIMIDFLRYPGLWPEYWVFHRGGRLEDEPDAQDPKPARVHWRRSDEPVEKE